MQSIIPLKNAEIRQAASLLQRAPIKHTAGYVNKNTLRNLSLFKKVIAASPYSAQPIILERANTHIIKDNKNDENLP